MSTDLNRFALNGPTMGTRWSATFFAPADFATAPVREALQRVVDRIDREMSTWNRDSDLMAFNRAEVGTWVALPEMLFEVVEAGLSIGMASGGAFDIALGEVVSAWGFGGAEADAAAIRATLGRAAPPAHDRLEIDRKGRRARKNAPLALDLSGIAKGFAADRMADVLAAHGIASALTALDGELCARGLQPDGAPWTIAIERPDYDRRAAHSALALEDAGIATSGDYRHWVEVSGRRLSHTMNPAQGGPLSAGPASVSVVARSAMEADAWATAFMILGAETARPLAAARGMSVLFLYREGRGIREEAVGPIFETLPDLIDTPRP